MLQKIEEEEGVYTTPNLKQYNTGEALFLRGYAFFQLWNWFGTSPVITERIAGTDGITQPGSEGTQLLDQAIADLQEAAGLLPLSWDDANRGRITSNAANGMISFMTQGIITIRLEKQFIVVHMLKEMMTK